MKKKIKWFVVLAVVSVLGLLAAHSPVFYITRVDVTGLSRLTKEDVTAAVGLNAPEQSIFAFQTARAKRKLLQNPYISAVTIQKDYPDAVRVSVKERVPRGCLQNINSFLYIDGEGRVLETRSAKSDKLPLLVGLDIDHAVVGEILDVQDKQAFEVMIELGKQLEKYELTDKVSGIDISVLSDIHIYVNDNLDIAFEDYSNADWKLSSVKEILKTHDTSVKGSLMIMDDKFVFVPLQ